MCASVVLRHAAELRIDTDPGPSTLRGPTPSGKR